MTAVRGWVYVIVNESIPGKVKVGYSTKDPKLRAKELNHTGSPTPYVPVYDALVAAPRAIEKRTHAALWDHHAGKEWFMCSVSTAIAAIRSAAGEALMLESSLAASLEHGIPFLASSDQVTSFATPEEKTAFVEKVMRALMLREQMQQSRLPMPTTPESERFKERALAAQKAWKSKQQP